MLSNRGKKGAGILSNRNMFGRKKSAEKIDEPAAADVKPGLNRQQSWIATGMPAPPKAVVQEVRQKNIQVKKENDSAVRIQANIKAKNAKVQVEGMKKQKQAETSAATRIQAIKRGQKARAEVAGLKGDEEYEEAPLNPLQKCTAGLADWFSDLMARCPCTAGGGRTLNEQMLTHAKPKHNEAKLSSELEGKLRELFTKMDKDNDKILSKAEAIEFWGKNFAKINAQAMFNEVDDDNNETISISEWLEFWQNVLGQDCYTEEDISEEVDSMLKGGSWVDWQDGRTT